MQAINLIHKHRTEVVALCERYRVLKLSLFGSAAADDWDPETSDLDVLVLYGPGRMLLDPLDALVGFQMGLEKVLGVRVDAVDFEAIRNQVFRENASSQAVELYAA